MLGTNGGGFFNANSAHPFENPTPWTNLLQMLSIFIIPAGLTYTLGRMTGSPGHGWAVLAAMFVLFAAGFTTVYWAESQPHPLLHSAAQTGTATAPAGNMEGKEVRNGISQPRSSPPSPPTPVAARSTACTTRFTPLGGMVVLINIMLGEVVFGGVGSGLVRHSDHGGAGGLHRRPDGGPHAGVSGQEDRSLRREDVHALRAHLPADHSFAHRRLCSVARRSACPQLTNQGPHGLTEILYAFTSGAGNNGSAFAGLNANTWWYNVALGWDMLVGRFLMMIPVLALAGNLAQKKSVPPSPGTFPVNGSLFTVLLVGVIVILGALTFFPALSLGPILEHLQLHANAGQLF